jgi:maleylpyruvate isomerase
VTRLALYSYWRSSSAWRVRIGLHHKGLEFETRPVDLRAGVQFGDEHRARNAMAQVPVLEVEEDGRVHHLSQSMAILEWLEERYPEPRLLPADPFGRARVRMLAEHVNAAVQPLQNQAPQKWLHARQPGLEGEFVRHFVGDGMRALEAAVAAGAGRFCHGDAPTLADVYLVPQLYAARRFGVDVEPLPTLLRIERACAELPAFQRAAPGAQPDAPAGERTG